VRRREKEDDDSPYIFCESCEQMYERALIQECPFCGKRFCRTCAVRSGQLSFCGRPCAKNWFFSGEDESPEDDTGGHDLGEP
jgi:hypothetical protein